jgi:hypothetical protein
MEDGKFQNGGGLGVKVMTDEQMEMLRKQISVYATICEQLVEMHKALSAHQDFAGLFLLSFKGFVVHVIIFCFVYL